MNSDPNMPGSLSRSALDENLQSLDGSGSDAEWAAVARLRELGGALAGHLLQRYRSARSWKARSACVYHAVRYARENDDAVTLGLEALQDRSKVVRYRACMLLAYSLRSDLVPQLAAVAKHVQGETKGDIEAAIDAIRCQNHHFFVDRDHSGAVTLNIR